MLDHGTVLWVCLEDRTLVEAARASGKELEMVSSLSRFMDTYPGKDSVEICIVRPTSNNPEIPDSTIVLSWDSAIAMCHELLPAAMEVANKEQIKAIMEIFQQVMETALTRAVFPLND